MFFFLDQGQLALLYTITRLSVTWILFFILCLIVNGRISQDVVYLSQQGSTNLILNFKSWYSRNDIGGRACLITFIFLSIPVTLLPSILMALKGVHLEPGHAPTMFGLQDYTTNNLTFDPTDLLLSYNPQVGSTEITTNVQWEAIDLQSITNHPSNAMNFDYVFNPALGQMSTLNFNTTFVNTSSVFNANGTFIIVDYHQNLSGYKYIKDVVTTPFNTKTEKEIVNNNTCYNMNVNIIPQYPTGITSSSSMTVWAALIDNNGTAILETGIVGFRSMIAGYDGYNCSVGQTMFLESDPNLCYDNWNVDGPLINGGGMFRNLTSNVYIGGALLTESVYSSWYLSSFKVVKSYYILNNVDSTKWRERTVLLGREILRNTAAQPVLGSGLNLRPPLNFTIGDTSLKIDSDLLAHLLFLVGSTDADLQGTYALGRIISVSSMIIWATVIIILPVILYVAMRILSKDLQLTMQDSWNSVLSSVTRNYGQDYINKPLNVTLQKNSGNRVDVVINYSVLRAIDGNESNLNLISLK